MGFLDKIRKTADDFTESAKTSLSQNEDLSNGILKMKSTLGDTATKFADSLPTRAEVKKSLIKQVVTTDYQMMTDSFNAISDEIPQVATDKLIPAIDVLRVASVAYNESTAEDREDVFLSCLVENIDAESVLEEVAPYIRDFPFGGVIVLILRLIIRYKKG